MADEEVTETWEVENIPDPDRLFLRVHKNWIEDDALLPGFFRDHGDGMSADWERYATPEETRARAKNPEFNKVISLVAGDIRAVPGQLVEHRPLAENRAHSEIVGDKKAPGIRLRLLRLARWEATADS